MKMIGNRIEWVFMIMSIFFQIAVTVCVCGVVQEKLRLYIINGAKQPGDHLPPSQFDLMRTPGAKGNDPQFW